MKLCTTRSATTNFDLQCEDECLECFFSERSGDPQERISEDDESIILIDAFEEEEDLEMLWSLPP